MNKKTLHLTLNKAAFDCMVTGEKEIEIRKPSRWIVSRLFIEHPAVYPYGFIRQYDLVKFVNGYGHKRPYFIAKFKTIFIFKNPHEVTFTTGLKVIAEPGDVGIDLGEIVERGNLTSQHEALIKRREDFVKSLSN